MFDRAITRAALLVAASTVALPSGVSASDEPRPTVAKPTLTHRDDELAGRQDASRQAVVWLGGVGADGQAQVGGIWDFEDGTLQGWQSVDLSAEAAYFRRITPADAIAHGDPTDPTMAGAGSMWVGAHQDEAEMMCWPRGMGYGDSWAMWMTKTFTYGGTGTITLSFDYFTDSETQFDYTYVYTEVAGIRSLPLNTSVWSSPQGWGYSGAIDDGTAIGSPSAPATDTIVIDASHLPANPGDPFTIAFKFDSDYVYSDELNRYSAFLNSRFGAFGVDDIGVVGVGLSDVSTFEMDVDGWSTFSEPPIGTYLDVDMLGSLPPIGGTCLDPPTNHVMVAIDGSGTYAHPQRQHEELLSPPAYVGSGSGFESFESIVARFTTWEELPLPEGVGYQVGARYHPWTCPETGVVSWSIVARGPLGYFFTFPGLCQTWDVDLGPYVPAGVDSIRLVFELLSDTEDFFSGSGPAVTDPSPLWDDIQLGVDFGSATFFARGSYYAGTTGIWGFDSGNQLHDDGLHGDDAAGDGIFGAFVVTDQPPGQHEFKIATGDWSQAYPTNPSYPTANAILYTEASDDLVHFRLDTNVLSDWQPAANAVSCDRFAPTGSVFEVIGSAPELGSWVTGVPATLDGDTWYADIVVASPGPVEYKFRVAGTWDVCNVGIHYNMFIGDNFSATIPSASALMRFEFNTIDGRSRARELNASSLVLEPDLLYQDIYPSENSLVPSATAEMHSYLDLTAGDGDDLNAQLGDSVTVAGTDDVGVEVYLNFRVYPGPAMDLNGNGDYSDDTGWWTDPRFEPGSDALAPSWAAARLDTAMTGEVVTPGMFATYFWPDGSNGYGSGNPDKVLPDDFFTPGTTVEYFFSTNYASSPADQKISPDTTAGEPLELEVLPGYVRVGSDILTSCVLYVDAAEEGAEELIEDYGLRPWCGSGFDYTGLEHDRWDRYDYQEAASTIVAPMARQVLGNNGMTPYQSMAYRYIFYSTGARRERALRNGDADLLASFLTNGSLGRDSFVKGLWLSGDGAGDILVSQGDSHAQALLEHFFQAQLIGHLIDVPPCCIRLDPTPTRHFPPSLSPYSAADHGTPPDERIFDVVGAVGDGVGDITYVDQTSGEIQTNFASVSNEQTSYHTVIDGFSLTQLREVPGGWTGCTCPPIGNAITIRVADVFDWFGAPAGSAVMKDVDPLLIDVDETASSESPRRTRLLRGAPNPFNPTTSVRYEIHERTEVTIQVLDVRGRYVSTLTSTAYDPGRYELSWDGRNAIGDALASGVYWVRMTTSSGYRGATRVILLK